MKTYWINPATLSVILEALETFEGLTQECADSVLLECENLGQMLKTYRRKLMSEGGKYRWPLRLIERQTLLKAHTCFDLLNLHSQMLGIGELKTFDLAGLRQKKEQVLMCGSWGHRGIDHPFESLYSIQPRIKPVHYQIHSLNLMAENVADLVLNGHVELGSLKNLVYNYNKIRRKARYPEKNISIFTRNQCNPKDVELVFCKSVIDLVCKPLLKKPLNLSAIASARERINQEIKTLITTINTENFYDFVQN